MRCRPLASCIVVCALACESASTPEPTPTERAPALTPRPAQPLSFDRLAISTTNRRDTKRRWVSVKGLAKFHEKLPEDARVTAKIACTGEGYVLADVANVQGKQSPFKDYDVGESADFYASFFFNAAPGALVPCQIDFAVDQPVATALGSACWREDEVTDGPCVPAIVPKPDATAPPVAVHDFVLTAAGKLDVTYMVRINQSPHPEVLLRLEAACDNFGMRSRLVDRESISSEPVMYAAGESVVRTAELVFRDSQLVKTDGGSPCEFTLWMTTKSEPAKVVLGEWCRRDGVLAEGSCREKMPTPTATPLDRDSFTIPMARLVPETRRKNEGPLVEIEALVRREKATIEQVTVRASMTCKLDGEKVEEEVRFIATDTNALMPGESTSLAGNSDFDRGGVPEWCEATFVAGERKGPTVEIGTWCMRDTTTERGACETR